MKWQNISVDIKTLSPGGCLPLLWGLSGPALGLYTCINSWKNCIKSDFKDIFFKLATNECMTKHFCWHQNFVPWGLSVPAMGAVFPCPGAIYMYKIMKKLYKIRLQRDFFEFAANDQSDKMFLFTLKFCPQWVVSPCPGAIYMYSIMKKMYKIRLQRDFFKLVANDRSDKKFLLTSKFCPLGLSAPVQQLYSFIKS